MKYRTRFAYITLFCLMVFLTITPHAYAFSNGVYLHLDLDFFNRFNPTSPYTDTFQRYHMLTLGYRHNDWQGQFTYNWYDKVQGAVSTHTITPWGLEVQYHLDDRTNAQLAYWWVADIMDTGYDTAVLRAQYNRRDPLAAKWWLQSQVGVKLVNHTTILPLIGGTVVYNNQFRFGLNDLDAVDDHLLDDADLRLNLPVNVGYTYRFNPFVTLDLDYYQDLLPTSMGEPERWFRTSFHFNMW